MKKHIGGRPTKEQTTLRARSGLLNLLAELTIQTSKLMVGQPENLSRLPLIVSGLLERSFQKMDLYILNGLAKWFVHKRLFGGGLGHGMGDQ